MTLVNDGRSGLEAVPNLLTKISFNRADFAELLVKLLQLTEGTHDVFNLNQLLSSFAKSSLEFKVLLEVISTQFVVQFQGIIELFNIDLISFPQVGSLFCWNRLDVVPLLLKSLEFVVVTIYLVRI